MLVLLQLVRTESALEIAEERAGSLEDALAETTVVAGEEKAKMDQELFLLKRRMDGVTGAKEAAADSMAALKQSAAEERAGKFAAEAALQAVRFLRTDLSAGLLLLLVLLLHLAGQRLPSCAACFMCARHYVYEKCRGVRGRE